VKPSACVIAAGVAVGIHHDAVARDLRTIWQFPQQTYPSGTLVRDANGNLFGETTNGGTTSSLCPTNGCGTIFELSPVMHDGQTVWTETTLYSFANTGDGLNPTGGLVSDSHGALYGATSAYYQSSNVIFKLVPPATGAGTWTEQTLATIPYPGHGIGTVTPLILDSAGNIYGAANQDGDGSGLIFRISPPAAAGQPWEVGYLFRFSYGDLRKGADPSGLTLDGSGGLYGAAGGGGQGYGTVFHLTPNRDGSLPWALTTLAYSHGAYGAYPDAAPLIGTDGALYIPAAGGGAKGCQNGCGTILKISPPASGQTSWSRTEAFGFTTHHPGKFPGGSLIADATGALFGVVTSTTFSTSSCTVCSGIYKLVPPAPGAGYWTAEYEYPVYDYPSGSLVADASGALYGTTAGYNGSGRVFKFTGGDFKP
jgi:hypothetical protein